MRPVASQLYKNTFVTPGARKGFGTMSEERKGKFEGIGFNFDKRRGPGPSSGVLQLSQLKTCFPRDHAWLSLRKRRIIGGVHLALPPTFCGDWAFYHWGHFPAPPPTPRTQWRGQRP